MVMSWTKWTKWEKILNVTMYIYGKVKACVRYNSELSDYFDYPICVKQGCVLSLLLFSFFIK